MDIGQNIGVWKGQTYENKIGVSIYPFPSLKKMKTVIPVEKNISVMYNAERDLFCRIHCYNEWNDN